MKFNRIIALLITIGMISSLMCSCSNLKNKSENISSLEDESGNNIVDQYEFVALEVGSFDSSDGGQHVSEYPIWAPEKLNYHQDISAPKEASVEFNGIKYTGTYEATSVFIPNTFLQHKYEGKDAWFRINATTGELCNFMSLHKMADKATISETECREIADDIADDYIDLNKYKVVSEVRPKDENMSCVFMYYREINGYKTADYMTVAVDGTGNIISVCIYMLGTFDDVEKIESYDDKVQEVIRNKLGVIYKENNLWKGYDEEDVILVKLDDGNIALLCTIKNEFMNGNYGFSTLTQLLIKRQKNSK